MIEEKYVTTLKFPSVCSGCFSLHLKKGSKVVASKKKKKKKKRNWKFFYDFWIVHKFLLIWNKSIQIETFETLRLQLVHFNKAIFPNINSLLNTKTVLHHPNIRLNYSTRLVLIIPNVLFLQKNQAQTQLLANLLSKGQEGWNEVQNYDRELCLG